MEHNQEVRLPAEVTEFLSSMIPIVILNTVSIGMMWPALPDILLTTFHQNSVSVANFLAKISALNAVIDFISNPILGAMSDKYGRRMFLIESLTVAVICNFTIAINGSPTAILIAKVAFGMLDCTKAMCYNMLVDTLESCGTKQSGRVKAFGLFGMAVGSGFALGPLIGGLIGMYSPRITALTAGGLMTISLLLAVVNMQETHLNRDKAMTKPFCTKTKVDVLTQYRVLVFFVPFILIGIAAGPYSIWFIYSEATFNWTPLQNGVFLFGHGCAQALSQGVFLSVISPTYLSEQHVVYIGLYSSALVFFSYSVLNESTSWLIFGIFPLIMTSYFTEPILRLIFTELVPKNDQGTLQGALASLSTLSNAIGPLVAASLFAFGSKSGPCFDFSTSYCLNPAGSPFLLSSCLILISMLCMKYAFKIREETQHLYKSSSSNGYFNYDNEDEDDEDEDEDIGPFRRGMMKNSGTNEQDFTIEL